MAGTPPTLVGGPCSQCIIVSASGLRFLSRPAPGARDLWSNHSQSPRRTVTPSKAKAAHRQNSLFSSINHRELPCKPHGTLIFRASLARTGLSTPPIGLYFDFFVYLCLHLPPAFFLWQTKQHCLRLAYLSPAEVLFHSPPLQPTSTRLSHRIASPRIAFLFPRRNDCLLS